MRSAHVDRFTAGQLPPREQWPAILVELPELRRPAVLNCGEELLDGTIARLGGDRRCLVTDTETWSYADLHARTDAVAHVLAGELGVVPGNRVLLRAPNTPWLVACWLAVMKVGAVAVSTMPLLRAAELATVIEQARPALALCDARLTEELERAAPADLPIVPVGGAGPDDLLRRSAGRSQRFAAVPTAAEDICLIAFTSGTTGRPKGCMHAHRDVLAIADTFSRHLVRPAADDLFVTSPPLAFTYGLGGTVVFPLRAGAASLLLERATPELLAAAVERHRATVCLTAPTAYRALLRLPLAGLSSLRRCVSAGEHLPRAVWEAWREATGLRIIDGIGSTEMLHIFISAADDDIRPGSTGRAVPGYQARVVDARGVPVPDGCAGRLAVRGPTGCRYLADERQRDYVQDGWNITGDAYVRDADGYFWFQARTDDMIISSGYNIAGPEVEDALLRHPDVLEAAVVGVPDAGRGSIVKAYVVLREGVPRGAATVADLQAFVKRVIAPYKHPRAVEFLGALPRTATGKLQRFRLRPPPAAAAEPGRTYSGGMTPHRLVEPAGMPPAIGFSHAVAAARGRTVWVAGQIGAGADGAVVGESLVEQVDAALGNVVTALRAAGAEPEHAVSMLLFTTAVDEYRRSRPELGPVYRRHFGLHFPAMALVGVTELVEPAAKVEVVTTAVIPDPAG